ncbi:MAG: amidohydrolase [Candidatus Riflebacteria bacterium]|nr:amidohydrolase [Candidatus Riflebacteria bacterium]
MRSSVKMFCLVGAFFLGFVPFVLADEFDDTRKIVSEVVKKLEPSLIEFRHDLHMFPELSNRESRTSQKIAEKLLKIGLDEVKTGIASTGIVAVLKGGKPGPTVAFRADMDALPIQETRDMPYKSQNPGVMHACGHDVHTTIGIGVAETLAQIKDQIPGTVKFIFQPAEEGAPDGEAGGAGEMIKQGALDNPRPDAIFGLHVESEGTAGKISLLSGPAMASEDGLKIVIIGKSAHGAKPHNGIDAIVVAANVINALQMIRSRRTDPREAFVLTLGTIHGGARANIIAERVEMVGTIRNLNENIRREAPDLIRQTVEGVCTGLGATCTVEIDPGYPVTYNNPELVDATMPALKRIFGTQGMFRILPHTGAEDFSKYQQIIPGLFFFIGIANPEKKITSAIHTPDFDVDESCIAVNTRAMSLLLIDYLRNHKN